MLNPPVHDSNIPVFESEKPRLVYQPPMLTRLNDSEIGTGATGVPEGNTGLLELES